MNKIKIGLMCLYIKLYDDCGLQDIRDRTEAFYEKIAQGFEANGIEVVRSSFCCVKPEFEAAVAKFEAECAEKAEKAAEREAAKAAKAAARAAKEASKAE